MPSKVVFMPIDQVNLSPKQVSYKDTNKRHSPDISRVCN
jgi:hypothetical protein